MFIAWTIVACFLLMGIWRRLRFLSGVMVSPLCCSPSGLWIVPAARRTGPASRLCPRLGKPALPWSCWPCRPGPERGGRADCLSQEHNLKFNRPAPYTGLLPPIQRLGAGHHRDWVIAGFTLLTLGLAGGYLVFASERGTFFVSDPKPIWSLVVWVAYGALLGLHDRLRAVGRRFAWSVIGAFVFVLLTFWGTNLPSTIHNP